MNLTLLQPPALPWNLPVFLRAGIWLPADRISGLADNDPVATWPDWSGNGRNATQGTPDNQPLYKPGIVAGKAVVRNDGTNDAGLVTDFVETSADRTQLTAVVVAKPAAGAIQIIAGHYDGNLNQRSWAMMMSAANNFRVIISTDGTTGASSYKDYHGGTNISAAFHILTMTWNNGVLALYVDGAAELLTKDSDPAFTTLHNSTAALSVGAALDSGAIAGFSLNGDIAEFETYPRALTAGELNRRHLQLGRKFGIKVS